MHPAATKHNEGPKSTPVFANGKLYSIGMTGIVTAFDAGTGKQLWQKPGSMPLPMFTSHSLSPLVDGGLVFFHIGGHMQGALTAFDVNTGAEKWSWNGRRPGYGSPIVAEFGGTRQLVTITQGKLVSLDPATGALLWERPYVSSNFTNAVTPVVYGQTVIVSGNGGPTMAFTVKKQNNQWVTENVWENADIPYRLSNSVLVGDALFGLSQPQQRTVLQRRREDRQDVVDVRAAAGGQRRRRPRRRRGVQPRGRWRVGGVPKRRDRVRAGQEIHGRRFRDLDAADHHRQSRVRP